MYDRPLNVEAALLYETRYPPIVFATLLARINARLAELGMVFNPTKVAGERFAMFTHPDMHLLISLNTDRLAPAGFADALKSPLIQAQNVDYAGLIGRHMCNIFITVGDGPIRKTPEMRAFEQKIGAAEDEKAADLVTKIKVLHRAMLEVFKLARPSLVHWCQSNNLFLPETIDSTERADFPTPLVTHHGLFSSGVDDNGSRRIGFVLNGSELFLGKPIVMQETSEPFSKVAAVTDCLIDQYLRGDNKLADGAIIPVAGEYQVTLNHLPPGDGFENGRIAARIAPISAQTSAAAPLAISHKAEAAKTHPKPHAAPAQQSACTAEGRPQALEVAMLYGAESREKQKPFEIEKFTQLMNLLGASRGIRFHPGNIEDGFVLVTPPGGPDLHITIQMADRPLDMARFARSRDLSHRKLAQSDLREAIETHIGYFKIRVVKGAVPMGDSPETNDFMTRIGMNSETAEEFETRLLLARGAADFIAQNSKVDVMHWVQSDKLYPGALALVYGHTAFPLGLLYTQPRFQSAGKDDQGKLLVGFQLFGAEHFLGRALLFAPNSAGTSNNLDLAMALLAHCYRENTLPGDGSLVGLDAGNCVSVAHIAPSEKLPFGAIRLTRITGHQGPLDMVLDGTQTPRSDFPSTLAEAAMNARPPNADGTPAQSRDQTAAELQALRDRVDAKTNGADKTEGVVTPGWDKLEQKLSKVMPGKGRARSAPANAPTPKKSHKIITYVLSALVIAKSLPIGALLILYHYRSGLSLKAAACALAAAMALPSLQQIVPRTTDLAGDPPQSTQMISLK